MTEKKAHEWISLTEATRRFNVSHIKISQMVRDKEIQSKADPRDKRKVLVDAVELQKKFEV